MVGADYGAIEHGALAVRDGAIAWVGAQADCLSVGAAQTVHDAQGAWITPGDRLSHAHCVCGQSQR